MRIRKARGGVRIDVDEVESSVLAHCIRELLELLTPPEREEPTDPLAALLRLSPGATLPADAALARLLPNAYGDDPEAALDFRRYTEADLRAGKVAHAEAMLATLPTTLPTGDARIVLDREQADAWLFTLNDLRLALGTRLGVTDDLEDGDPDPDDEGDPDADERLQGLEVFGWLGLVQETLVEHLQPRPDPGHR